MAKNLIDIEEAFWVEYKKGQGKARVIEEVRVVPERQKREKMWMSIISDVLFRVTIAELFVFSLIFPNGENNFLIGEEYIWIMVLIFLVLMTLSVILKIASQKSRKDKNQS